MQNTSAPYDLLVIGAGISGLAAAHYGRQQGWSVHVLESRERPGGCLHSHVFSGLEPPGFWLELGAHTGFNSYGHLLDILADLDGLSALCPKPRLNYQLWVEGCRRTIPAQLHWWELVRSCPRLFTLDKTTATVAGYYGAIAGPNNYQEVLGPAFNAVICQDATDFPAASLFRKRTRRQDYPKSFSFLPSAGQLPSAAQPGGLSWIIRCLPPLRIS